MKFLEKIRDFSYVVHIKVKTNSKSQSIINKDEFLTISVRSKPIQNKANKELINLLKRKLEISSNQIQIISGLKGSNKLIQLNFLEEVKEREIYNKLIL
ncbi:MAG: DUF167 domain-containing protein [Promethearchaeota archaeon]|jgi:uncharacterized protein YggU (UPF0235/DUF167 family)